MSTQVKTRESKRVVALRVRRLQIFLLRFGRSNYLFSSAAVVTRSRGEFSAHRVGPASDSINLSPAAPTSRAKGEGRWRDLSASSPEAGTCERTPPRLLHAWLAKRRKNTK